jgi:hypothetical protein
VATYEGLSAVSAAVLNLLSSTPRPPSFPTLEFQAFTARQFTAPPFSAGISLFLYRVFVHGTHRTPPGRLDSQGRRMQAQLPLEMHFLLSVWAPQASLQHSIAGWMMRTLEDTPLLPSGVLNAVSSGVFRPDEVVEIVPGELSNEDLFRIWETIAADAYQLSVPYLSRVVRIESTERMLENGGGLVQERLQRMAVVEAPASAGQA